jgi:hypothetical protein
MRGNYTVILRRNCAIDISIEVRKVVTYVKLKMLDTMSG